MVKVYHEEPEWGILKEFPCTVIVGRKQIGKYYDFDVYEYGESEELIRISLLSVMAEDIKEAFRKAAITL